MISFQPGWVSGQNTDWAIKSPIEGEFIIRDIHQDFYRNYYCIYTYKDSIFFEDTVFGHPDSYYTYKNYAIAKYDYHGNFINAVDLYTNSQSYIFDAMITTDKDLNLYIAGDFSRRIFVQDTFINHGGGPYPDSPEVFVMKLNSDLDFQWSNLVSGTVQDGCAGLLTYDDTSMIMLVDYHCNYSYGYAVILQEDTIYYSTPTNSLIRLTNDGELIWHREIGGINTQASRLQINKFKDRLYINGTAYDNLTIGDDTIYHPYPSDHIRLPFLIEYDPSGNLIDARYFDFYMGITDFIVDNNHDIYFSGYVWDSLIIGNDTVWDPVDTTTFIVAKVNKALDPYWYEAVYIRSTYSGSSIYLNLVDNDSLFFSMVRRHDFNFFGIDFSVGGFEETIQGIINTEGELLSYSITESTRGLKAYHQLIDHCNNNVLAGYFKGEAYFKNDTLIRDGTTEWDGFISYHKRINETYVSLGNDTIVCENIVLYAPPDYHYFMWNDSLTTSNQLIVDQTGLVILSCATENACWTLTDSIYIIVEEKPELHLNDTTINLSDTISYSIQSGFDHYLWSTGDTTSSILLIGKVLGTGMSEIWVQVESGVCSSSDTINIEVIDDTDIEEQIEQDIQIYPNPAFDKVYMQITQGKFYSLEITNINGVVVNQRKIDPLLKIIEIKLENYEPGVYYIIVKSDEKAYVEKLILF